MHGLREFEDVGAPQVTKALVIKALVLNNPRPMPRAPSILLLLLGAPAAQSWSAESAASAKALLTKMNRTEKIAMVHGYGPKVVPGGVGYVVPNERLGIPPLILANGPQGWGPWTGEAGNSTCWPSGLTVGATWDPALAERWGAAMGEEFFEKGTNVQLGPGLCVNRVPTCGRAFEYISGVPLPPLPPPTPTPAPCGNPRPCLQLSHGWRCVRTRRTRSWGL